MQQTREVTFRVRSVDRTATFMGALRSGKHADVAQLVERNLAKVEVAGSIPVIRSKGRRVKGFLGPPV